MAWVVGVVLMGATWIGLFSYKHVEYTNDLWWRFAYNGDAPRFLRSSLILAVMVLSFCVYRLMRVQPEKAHLPTQEEIQELKPIVHHAPDTQNHLALIGDKIILWGQNRESFSDVRNNAKVLDCYGRPCGEP